MKKIIFIKEINVGQENTTVITSTTSRPRMLNDALHDDNHSEHQSGSRIPCITPTKEQVFMEICFSVNGVKFSHWEHSTIPQNKKKNVIHPQMMQFHIYFQTRDNLQWYSILHRNAISGAAQNFEHSHRSLDLIDQLPPSNIATILCGEILCCMNINPQNDNLGPYFYFAWGSAPMKWDHEQ